MDHFYQNQIEDGFNLASERFGKPPFSFNDFLAMVKEAEKIAVNKARSEQGDGQVHPPSQYVQKPGVCPKCGSEAVVRISDFQRCNSCSFQF